MSVLSKEEFNSKLKQLVGENNDDDTISIIEDFNDTYDSLNVSQGDGEDWKTKFEENDKMWREKYTNRFFDSEPSNATPDKAKKEQQDDVEEDGEKKTYADLFEERED